MASALTGLVATAAACGSDSKDDPAQGGMSATDAGSGGRSSNSAGKAASNDAGKASNSGGSGNDAAGGEVASGGEPDTGGGTDGGAGKAAGGTSAGGSASGNAGSSSAGTGSGTLPGDNVWNCIAGGTSCICQNNGDPKTANTCTGEYKCCFALPLGDSTRCQCQDPYTSKCSDLAGFTGGKVVDHCPP